MHYKIYRNKLVLDCPNGQISTRYYVKFQKNQVQASLFILAQTLLVFSLYLFIYKQQVKKQKEIQYRIEMQQANTALSTFMSST